MKKLIIAIAAMMIGTAAYAGDAPTTKPVIKNVIDLMKNLPANLQPVKGGTAEFTELQLKILAEKLAENNDSIAELSGSVLKVLPPKKVPNAPGETDHTITVTAETRRGPKHWAGITFKFPEDQAEALSQMKKGSIIKARGVITSCTYPGLLHVELSDCTLLPTK